MPIIISQPCMCDLYERMEFYVSAREMSRVQAMEEYIRVALSLKQETDVGGYCYDEESESIQ